MLIVTIRESVAVVYPACLWSSVLLVCMESAYRGPFAANDFKEQPLLPALSDARPTSFAMIVLSLRNRGWDAPIVSGSLPMWLVVAVGDGDLEDGFCQTDGDGHTRSHGLLLFFVAESTTSSMAPGCRIRGREESIPSAQPTPHSARGG